MYVEFWWWSSAAVMLATEVAGIMAPEAEATETSNWNTSVHMPELNMGPEPKRS